MGIYRDSVINILLDREPQEWIVGLVVALFLALALAGAHMAAIKWLKATEGLAPLVAMSIIAIFAGMVIAGIYVQLTPKVTKVAGPPGDGRPPGGGFGGGGGGRGPGGGGGGGRLATTMTNRILETADADHDGRLSIEEAANAAAKFVKEADTTDKGGLDHDALLNLLRESFRPPGGGPPTPSPAPTIPTTPEKTNRPTPPQQ
jgi:hypothetical protein